MVPSAGDGRRAGLGTPPAFDGGHAPFVLSMATASASLASSAAPAIGVELHAPIPPLTPVPNLPRTKCPPELNSWSTLVTGDKLQGSRALALLYYLTCRETPGDTGDSLYDLIL